MFDTNHTGKISAENIAQVLKMMVGQNVISSKDMDRIAQATVAEADHDHDGELSFEDFCGVLQNVDWKSKLSIDF